MTKAILFDADRPGSVDVWPNYYRPSYRTPPVRSPLHVVGESDGGRVEADAIAIALTEYPMSDGGLVSAAFLCQGGVHSLSLTLNEWLRRIEWVGAPAASSENDSASRRR